MSQLWRALIVDDEPPARESLRLLLDLAPDFRVAGECGNGEDALEGILALRPDVLFLDVQMPGMDGFEVLRRAGPATVPALVFVTAFDRYALQAFEQHALDYLLKPFSDERFSAVLDKVRLRLSERRLAGLSGQLQRLLDAHQRGAPLVVRDGSRTVVVPLDDIVWIEAEDYCVRIHLSGRSVLVRESLRTLEQRLDRARFARVHRSAIANVECIRELSPLASGDQRLVMSNGTELRASRTHRAELLKKLKGGHPFDESPV
ncbi:MAG TPA: LytTR family DNA-binding domain-containing protein [Vicinamibacterales bacterium]|jgi:two-component system, LytTR family, response regulator|nr:LytTR family DNA-binding domain-containing protein [Vicinamibacterales bacterium]